MKRRRFTDLLDAIVDHIKGFVLAMIVIITVLGALVGYKYYRHTQDDPEFCLSCHMMKEAFAEWQRGKHRDIVCQECHHLSLLEQNHLLVSFVVNRPGPFSQKHGRERPWGECRKCHVDVITQGSKSVRDSYGHAKHVFTLNQGCKACHGKSLHLFIPDENACQDCHQDKGVHGFGMEAFSCLKCHSFSEKTAIMAPQEKCLGCHKVPKEGPMSGLQCHQCHKPHGEIKPKSEDCLGLCHRSEAKVGQHGVHMRKGVPCSDCHKAHTWVVGEKNARGLCNRCHPMKSPRSFIY